MDFVMIVILHLNLKVVQYVKLKSVDVSKLSKQNNEYILFDLFYHFIEYKIYDKDFINRISLFFI